MRGGAAMETSQHPELTPQIRAEIQAQLEQRSRRLQGELATRRRAEGVDDTPDQDPSADLRGDMGDESVELEAWDTSRQEELDIEAQLGEVEHALEKFA